MIWTQSNPVAPVTVAEAKAHLRIDADDEDTLIADYIITATSMAEQIMNREVIYRNDSLALAQDSSGVPQAVKHFVLCLTGDYFSHRELTDKTGYAKFFQHLLDPWILYNRIDEEDQA